MQLARPPSQLMAPHPHLSCIDEAATWVQAVLVGEGSTQRQKQLQQGQWST